MQVLKSNKNALYLFITIATGVAYFTVFAHRLVPAVVAVDMAADIGATPAYLGLLGSAYFYSYGLAQMPYGVLADTIGPRKIMFFSFLLAGVGGVMFSFSPTPIFSFIARLLLGLGCAATLVCAMTLLARWIPKDNFPKYLTLLYIIGGFGPLLVASPLAWGANIFGWRIACFIIAVFTLIYAFVLLAVVRDYPAEYKKIEKKEKKSIFSGVKIVASNFQFWLIVIFGFGVPSIYLIYCGLWAGPYITHIYAFDKQIVGHVLSFGAIGSVLGFLLGPVASEKIFKSRKKAMLIFAIILFIDLLPFVFQIKLPFFLLCIQTLFIGIFSCGVQPVAVMAIKEMFPIDITGAALGMFNTFPLLCGGLLQFIIGLILSNLMAGSVEATIGMYAISFSVMLVACFCGIVAISMLKTK